jgi:cellulose synthase (UDP-forming)
MLIETFLYWSAAPLFRLLALLVPTAYLLLDIQAVYAHVPDGIYHFLPFLLVQIAVISWLTQRRVMPILGDLSQLLGANDIAKSVIVGLFKPKGHKFTVTAKGGDRTRRFTQWPMLRIFLIYLALTISGIVWAFALDDFRPLAEASLIALIWSWYNIVLLVLACFVCIEAIRFGDRFRSDGRATLTVGERKLSYPIVDISVSGMRLAGNPPEGIDRETIPVQFDGVDVTARILRTYNDGFALQFIHSMDARERLIRHIYGGKYGGKTREIKPSEVVSAMLGRVFR